jgi:hypothetical protein
MLSTDDTFYQFNFGSGVRDFHAFLQKKFHITLVNRHNFVSIDEVAVMDFEE